MSALHVASVCFVRDRELLTVRKAGAQRFMLPGGKLEPEETPLGAAVREVREELGVECGRLELLGDFEADAANEPGLRVRSSTYLALQSWSGAVEAQAEIAETRWQPLDPPYATDLAPLLLEHVLPALRSRD